jgi:pimeloyl-ACP methyl ester carboxylesterase
MATDRFVQAPGGRLFVRIWGTIGSPAGQPAIILFHDSLGCVELWRDFPLQLASTTGLPVIAYDRLGFGRSDPHPGRLKFGFVEDEARTVVPELRSVLGIERMVLFGHSVGGGMAVASAAAFHDASAALVTESAQAFVEDRTLAGIHEGGRTFSAPDQLARLARYHGEKARWVVDAWTETWLAPQFAAWNLDDNLRSLRCPVLAIHGDRDEYGSSRHPERICTLPATPTQSLILADCGHVPHREKPDQVLDAVKQFLDPSIRGCTAAPGATDRRGGKR